MTPLQGQTWFLKSNPKKTLVVAYVNCCGIVGFKNATHRKKTHGTLILETFLKRYRPA